ncbi:MAG: hypothetical protein ICV53_16270, partial [Flavisolibacter sp.]|nr:hypothetical protein [Flavisolibacter sp.]
MKTIKHFSLLFIAFSILISGCSSMNRSQKGAVIGATGGAAMGGIIGKA